MILSLIIGCGKKEEKQDSNLLAWKRSTITGRTLDNKSIPTAYILDCRKLDSLKNIHYYYSVVVNPESVKINSEGYKKELIYSDAQFDIEYVLLTKDGNGLTTMGLFSSKVDFKIVEDKEGQTAFITANKETMSQMHNLNLNPRFEKFKEGDELITFFNPIQSNLTKINKSKVELPGIKENESLECR